MTCTQRAKIFSTGWHQFPLVRWYCQLGDRKGTCPVKPAAVTTKGCLFEDPSKPTVSPVRAG